MQRRRGINQPNSWSDVNIVLLGKTGAGKSASGNTIKGGRPFLEKLSPSSVTKACDARQTVVNEQTITVIDTVGLPDVSVELHDFQHRIEQIFDYARNGVDVFLLVIKVGDTFTREYRNVVNWIQDNFGPKLLRHTIVLFTYGDQLNVPIERYWNKCENLRSVVDHCSGRYHVFNNKEEDPSQVTELLDKINTLKEMNRSTRYTEQDYKETQDKILERTYFTSAAVGGGVGGLGGAAAGAAIAAKAGAVVLTVGKAVVIGAAGGAAVAAVIASAGVYFLARRYIPINRRT